MLPFPHSVKSQTGIPMRAPTSATVIERLLEGIDVLLRLVLSGMVFGIFAVLFAQVMCRYVFSLPLYWSEELAKYLMVYVTTIGAAVAYRNYAHPHLMIVTAMLTGSWLKWYDLVLRIPILIFFSVFAYVGWHYAVSNEWMTTPGMQISFFWPFFAVPLGAAAVLVYLVLDTANILIYGRSWLLPPDHDPILDPTEFVA